MPSSEARRYRLIVPERSTPSPPSSSSSTKQKKRLAKSLAIPKHDEEYLTKRKVEVKTKKNTEKRVQRQVVLRDGRVIAQADPEVIVDTIEDTKNYEEERLENRDRLEDEHEVVIVPRYHTRRPKWTEDNVVDDNFSRKINTHDVKENVKTTRTMGGKVVGVVKRRELDRALRDNRPLSEVIQFSEIDDRHRSKKKKQSETREDSSRRKRREAKSYDRIVHRNEVMEKPKVIYRSRSHKKIVDTEDVHNICKRDKNGKLYTETYRTEQHEVFDDKDTPDEGTSVTSSERIIRDRENFRQAKKDEFTEYYRVPKGSKTLKDGEYLGKGAHATVEEKEVERGEFDWDGLSERIRENRRLLRQKMGQAAAERMDALTKRPLNFHQEEKTRQKETDKWLERHFGSTTDDWSSISGSNHSQRALYKSNGDNGVRRSMSFSSIPIRYPQESRVKTTKTKERIVKTTTTTYSPGMEKTVKERRSRSELQPQRYRKQIQRPVSQINANTYYNLNANNNNYRKYNSTLSLLPPPKVDYSLHGDSSLNGDNESVRNNKQKTVHQTANFYGSTTSLGRPKMRQLPRNSPPIQSSLLGNKVNNYEEERSYIHRSHSANNYYESNNNQNSGYTSLNNNYSVPIVEERYTDSSTTNVPSGGENKPKEKRVYPTIERKNSKENRVVYRSGNVFYKFCHYFVYC